VGREVFLEMFNVDIETIEMSSRGDEVRVLEGEVTKGGERGGRRGGGE
jgi:hypothetical protein